jgi:eukaryotic-like serine/threonine-protein kinase
LIFGAEAAEVTALPQQRIVERYVAGQWVACGGQGKIMKGQQFHPNRPVAMKVIKKIDVENPIACRRFHRELELLGRLNSPYLITILEGGFDTDFGPVIVMEWVEGCSLKEHLERSGALPIREVVAIALDVAKALRHLEMNGVVHRDLKPGNIMLPVSGEPKAKVIDLGIARVLTAPSDLTATGDFVGTWKYSAPEHLELQSNIDARADGYSFGLVIHEMLLGRHAFAQIVRKAQFAEVSLLPVRRLRADVPQSLCALLRSLTAYNCETRPKSDEVVRALEEIARELS